MTNKILVWIDPDTQRVVPVEPTTEMFAAANKVDDEMYCGGSQHGADNEQIWYAMIAAAPQPEPVDVDLRRDAELWRSHQKRKQLTVVKDCDDDRYFAYDLSREKIGPQVCIAEIVTIDAAMLSQGEQK